MDSSLLAVSTTPPEGFSNGFEARAWEQTVPRDVRHQSQPDADRVKGVFRYALIRPIAPGTLAEDHRARRREMLIADQQRLCTFVAAHPPLMSALYDLDLMPLDLPPELVDARAWSRIVRIVALYAEAAGLEPAGLEPPWLTPAVEALCPAVFLARADVRPAASSPVCARCGGAHVSLEPPP